MYLLFHLEYLTKLLSVGAGDRLQVALKASPNPILWSTQSSELHAADITCTSM